MAEETKADPSAEQPTAGDILTENLANDVGDQEAPVEGEAPPPAEGTDKLLSETYNTSEDHIKAVDSKWEKKFNEIEESLSEARAENTFLKGRVQELSNTRQDYGRVAQPAAPAAPEGPKIDREAIKAAISGNNPDAAVDAIVSTAKTIAEYQTRGIREAVNNDMRVGDAVRNAMEEDKANVIARFGEDMKNPDFIRALEQHQRAATVSAGRYVAGSLYRSAAAARIDADSIARQKNGGIQRLRTEPPKTPVESSPGDYRRAQTIDTLPGYTAQEKQAVKNYIRRTPGMTEAKWLKSYKAAKSEDSKLGE